MSDQSHGFCGSTMKTAVLLFLLLHGAAAVTRSLKYFYTASSGVPNFPQFVIVGQVDGVEMFRYDSNTRRAEPKQDWMDTITAEEPNYWQTQTQIALGAQAVYINNIKVAKERFNQTGGVHMFQRMYGCEWDDQTGDIDGFDQFGFDGEDFLSLDLKSLSYVASKPQAVVTKNRWNSDRALLESKKHYRTQECIEWLNKYVKAGSSSLLRTELPSVSFLQKTPSSAISCFATGFFPERAVLLWRKEGEELVENVDVGEVLPNHDGTFQMSADLTLPEDAKDHHKYECVFQLSGIKEDKVYRLDTSAVKTNHPNPHTIIFIVVGVLACVVLAAILGFIIYRSRQQGGL